MTRISRVNPLEVTSALPLSKDEEEAVKKDVLAKVGAKEVTFRVDPSILGGLVIRVGDKVLDGSVAGKLEGLRQSLEVNSSFVYARGFWYNCQNPLFV